MAYRIKTGWNVTQRNNSEIVVVVTSLRTLAKHGVPFLFTDRHASVIGSRFTHNLEHLDRIDWGILQQKDFKRDNEDLGKSDRYQAEALAYGRVPVDALLGMGAYDNDTKAKVDRLAKARHVSLQIVARPGWYFQ